LSLFPSQNPSLVKSINTAHGLVAQLVTVFIVKLVQVLVCNVCELKLLIFVELRLGWLVDAGFVVLSLRFFGHFDLHVVLVLAPGPFFRLFRIGKLM
jgi:hypothetical protein